MLFYAQKHNLYYYNSLAYICQTCQSHQICQNLPNLTRASHNLKTQCAADGSARTRTRKICNQVYSLGQIQKLSRQSKLKRGEVVLCFLRRVLVKKIMEFCANHEGPKKLCQKIRIQKYFFLLKTIVLQQFKWWEVCPFKKLGGGGEKAYNLPIPISCSY
jgi:hypothetical protein